MRAPVAMLCLLCGHLAVASVPCSATEPAVAEPAAAQTSAGRLVLGALEQRLRTRADFQQATVAGTGAPDDASVRWGGAHLYASTGLASVNEVVDIGRRRSYQQLSANVGVSWANLQGSTIMVRRRFPLPFPCSLVTLTGQAVGMERVGVAHGI